jgi:hypothetical protein
MRAIIVDTVAETPVMKAACFQVVFSSVLIRVS